MREPHVTTHDWRARVVLGQVARGTGRHGLYPTTLMLILALAASVPIQVSAADKQRPIERTLFVPYDDIPVILGGKNERVFMDRAEYQRLKRLANRRVPEKSPIAATVAHSTYRVSIDGTTATIRGTLNIIVEQSGIHAVALPMSGVRPRLATLDNKPAPLGHDTKGRPELLVEGAGTHCLEIELQAGVAIAAAQQTLAFQVPCGTSCTLHLQVPGNVEIKSGAGVIARRYDQNANRTEFDLLPSRGPMSIVMSLNNKRLRRQQIVVARSVLVSELTTTYERLHASVTLDVLHGAIDQIEFTVPDAFQITAVTGTSVSQWRVRNEGGADVLQVGLRRPARDTVALSIAATRVPVVIGHWSMPQLEAKGVSGQIAVVGLLVETRLRPLTFQQRDLIQIDTSVLRNALPSSVFAAAPGAPRIRPLVAYYAPSGSFALNAKLEEPADELRVATHLMLALDENQQTLRGGFTLLPQGRITRTFAFQLPSQWVLQRVYGTNNQSISYQRFQTKGPARYVVSLPVAIEPGKSTTVYFKAVRTSAKWLSNWTETDVEFPAVKVERAKRSTGAIAVQATGDLAVRPLALRGLAPLDSSQRSRFGLSATGDDLAYQVQQDAFHATFDVQRIKPRLASRNYAFFQINTGVLRVHYELFFDITRAHAKRLQVALPESTPQTIAVRGLDGVAIKEFSAVREGDQRVWNVRLAKPHEGLVHLAIDFEQRIEGQRVKDLNLPLPRALGVRYQTQMVTVEGDSALDVRIKTPMRRVDIGEFAEATYVPGRRLLGAYASTTDVDRLRVDVALRDLRPLPAVIVQHAELVTLVSRQGLTQSVARYLLRTKVPLLAVRLPAGAELWSAVLDHKPIRPQRRGNQILLSLQSDSPGTARDLQLVYQTPIDTIGWVGHLSTAAPRLWLVQDATDKGTPVPQANLVWRVHLPAGYRVSRADGTVFSDAVARPKLPFSKMVRTAVALGGGVLPMRTWRAGLSGNRELQTNQLTQLGMAVHNYEDTVARPLSANAGRQPPNPFGQAPAAGVSLSEKIRDLKRRAKTDRSADRPALRAGTVEIVRPPSQHKLNYSREREGLSRAAGARAARERLLKELKDRKLQASPFGTPSAGAGPGMGGAEMLGGGGASGMGGMTGGAGMMGAGGEVGAGSPSTPAGGKNVATNADAAEKNAVTSKPHTAQGPAKQQAKLAKYWALQGVGGLRIEIEDNLQAVTFQSLGAAPVLRATLYDSRRLDWLAWAAALLVIAFGLTLTRRAVVTRIWWLAAILLPACLLSAVGGPMTEFIGVLEMMIVAALLLIPIWILVAFLRRVRKWLRILERFVRRIAVPGTIGLFVVASLAAPHAVGQDLSTLIKALKGADTPVVIPDDAVVIPYDPADPTSRNRAKRVLVPYAQYQRLWQLAHPEEKVANQRYARQFATAGAAYSTILADGTQFELTGTLDIVLFADGPVQVPLTLAGAVITSAQLDGKPAQLAAVMPLAPAAPARQQQQAMPPVVVRPLVSVIVAGRGHHRLALTLRVAVQRQGGWRRVTAAVPAAEATSITMSVPNAGTQISRVLDGTQYSRTTTKPNETMTAALDPNGRLKLGWRPRVTAGDVDQALTAESQAVVDVAADGVHVMWHVVFKFGQTQRNAFQITIPAHYLVEKVKGKNVRGWDLSRATGGSKGSGPSVLNVELLKAVKQSEQVTIQLARRVPLATATPVVLDLPVLGVVDAALHRGMVRIRRSLVLDVQTADTAGVARADASAAGKQLQALTGNWPSPLGMRDYQTFRFNATPFRVSLRVAKIKRRVSAQLRTLVRIGETEAALESSVHVRTSARPVYAVRVAIPARLKLAAVTAPGISDWTMRADGAQRVLTAFFAGGRTGAFDLVLHGRLPDHQPKDTVTLPQLTVLDAEHQDGMVVVQSDASLDVRATDLTNCRSVLLDRATSWLDPAQKSAARLALEYSTVPYGGSVTLVPRSPRITCLTISNVRLTYRALQETILLDFDIRQAGVRQLVFQLPARLQDAQISAPMIRQKTVTPMAGTNRVRVQLDLQDAVMGQYRVIVQDDHLLLPGKQSVPIPWIESGQTNYRYVTLENAGRDEVVVDPKNSLQKVARHSRAWKFLVGRLQSAGFNSAYVTTGGAADVAFAFSTKRRATVKTAGANIGLARTQLVMDAGGAYRASMLLKVNNRTEPYLEIELPNGATLWTAHVAGQPVKPARVSGAANARRLRIPLVKTAAGDLDYSVILKYGGTIGSLSSLKAVGFPMLRTININTELSQVELHLPPSYDWYHFDGTAHKVAGESDFLAGYVAYRTKQVEGLTRVLRGKDFFSASRAYENVKQLESEVRGLQRRSARMAGSAQLRQNIDYNAKVLATARQEMARMKRKSPPAVDNRRRLNDLYQAQKAVLSRNEVLRLGDNFAPPTSKTQSAKSRNKNAFDDAWFQEQPSLPQLNAAPRPPADRKAGKRTSSARQRFGKSAQGQARKQPTQAAAEQAAQNVFQRLPAKGAVQQAEAPTMAYPDRDAWEEQAKRAYTDRLERESGGDKAKPSRKKSITSWDKLSTRRTTTHEAALDGAKPAAGGGQTAPGKAVAQGLSSLDFTLPVRGVTYYFTAPRGDVKITAVPVSVFNMDRLQSLGCLLALALLTWVALVVARRAQRSSMQRVLGAWLFGIAGLAMLVTAVLPVYGVVLLAAAIVLVTKDQ